MPRPKRSYGRPGTRVIPKNWSASHGKVMEGTWTGACEIYPPQNTAPKAIAHADLTVTPGGPINPIYVGPCRLQVLNSQDASTIIADQDQVTVGYLVVIHRDAEIPLQAVIKITDASDTSFPERRLVVRKVSRGTEIWERDLYAVDDLTAPAPE